MCILPSLTYGCQTWTLNEKIINRLKVTQNAIERSMLDIKKTDHCYTQTIKEKRRGNTDVVRYVKRQKWGWVGHIARMNDN